MPEVSEINRTFADSFKSAPLEFLSKQALRLPERNANKPFRFELAQDPTDSSAFKTLAKKTGMASLCTKLFSCLNMKKQPHLKTLGGVVLYADPVKNSSTRIKLQSSDHIFVVRNANPEMRITVENGSVELKGVTSAIKTDETLIGVKGPEGNWTLLSQHDYKDLVRAEHAHDFTHDFGTKPRSNTSGSRIELFDPADGVSFAGNDYSPAEEGSLSDTRGSSPFGVRVHPAFWARPVHKQHFSALIDLDAAAWKAIKGEVSSNEFQEALSVLNDAKKVFQDENGLFVSKNYPEKQMVNNGKDTLGNDGILVGLKQDIYLAKDRLETLIEFRLAQTGRRGPDKVLSLLKDLNDDGKDFETIIPNFGQSTVVPILKNAYKLLSKIEDSYGEEEQGFRTAIQNCEVKYGLRAQDDLPPINEPLTA